jgi:hypothetical protein
MMHYLLVRRGGAVVAVAPPLLLVNDGEIDTSTTTAALARTSAKSSPVSVLTPEAGDAGTAWWPCSRSLRTSFEGRGAVART